MPCKSDNPVEVGTHVFERSGCGRAPFTFIGFYESRAPACSGSGVTVGSPGQPTGTCRHCGMGIALCCTIRDADGKTFVVGSTCVEKTGDAGLIRGFKKSPEFREHQRAVRHAREDRNMAAVRALLDDEANRAALSALPHGRGFTDRETGEALTRLDEFEYLWGCSGASGRCRLKKPLLAALAG